MIPKIVHYCWFGRGALPESAQKCLASFQKFFPDYEIIEWNEDNYDVGKIPYIKEAYEARKYAFVSDYARFDILYQMGGLYFDTDVEIIKPFDDILCRGAFMGCEVDASREKKIQVAPGLGIGAEPSMPVYRAILDYYADQHFLMPDGSLNTETVVTKTTHVLRRFGLQDEPGIQTVGGITVYPKCYFNPRSANTGKLCVTPETHSIHWYSMSWMSGKQKARASVTRCFHRVFGENCFAFLKRRR